MLLLNILVNICCRQANLRNILFADNPNIRGYCFTKKISPLKSEILFVNSSQPKCREDKDYINEEEILSFSQVSLLTDKPDTINTAHSNLTLLSPWLTGDDWLLPAPVSALLARGGVSSVSHGVPGPLRGH